MGMANNGMTDAHRAALPVDSQEYHLRVVGSVIQLSGWSVYSVLLWSLKASWLVFYLRLTVRLHHAPRRKQCKSNSHTRRALAAAIAFGSTLASDSSSRHGWWSC